MRVEFVNSLLDVLANDPKSIFITGDLGFNAFEEIQKKYGLRFLNAGAAEQNMVGVSAGLAVEGFRSFVYSIAPFATYRCLEQIRNDVCLHNLPVCVVGNGGGYTYGIMGATHHTLEDMAVLKALPNMTLYLPCTNNHVPSVMKQISSKKGPSYLRLGFPGYQSNREPMTENTTTLTRRYSTGSKVTVIGIGQGTQVALKALDDKLLDPKEVSVFGLAQFPFDFKSDKELYENCQSTQNVIVLEEHYLPGSLCESLRLELTDIKKFRQMLPYYSKDHNYGSPKFHAEQTEFTPKKLVQLVAE